MAKRWNTRHPTEEAERGSTHSPEPHMLLPVHRRNAHLDTCLDEQAVPSQHRPTCKGSCRVEDSDLQVCSYYPAHPDSEDLPAAISSEGRAANRSVAEKLSPPARGLHLLWWATAEGWEVETQQRHHRAHQPGTHVAVRKPHIILHLILLILSQGCKCSLPSAKMLHSNLLPQESIYLPCLMTGAGDFQRHE